MLTPLAFLSAQEKPFPVEAPAGADSVVALTPYDIATTPLIPYHHTPETPSDSTAKRNFIQKIISYFDNSNKPKPQKNFDITFIGGPSYSESTSLQLAAVGTGLYHSRLDNGLTPESDLSLKLQGSITGFYRVGVSGNHFGPEDRYRIVYDANFLHFPLYFWGIGWDMQHIDANKSKYTKLQANFDAEFQWRLPRDIFVGVGTYFRYGKATKAERPELWCGQDPRQFNYGLGLMFSYDTRDNINSAHDGWNIELTQKFFPRFLFNSNCFSETEFTAAFFHTLWKGGVLAAQAHADITYGNTPWIALPTLDQSGAMRSYYEARYSARREADLVFELRQRMWRRNGLVVWLGVGSVFNKFRDININTILPSVGVGYRWELKKNVNVRVDLGLGRHSTAISLGIHEAF